MFFPCLLYTSQTEPILQAVPRKSRCPVFLFVEASWLCVGEGLETRLYTPLKFNSEFALKSYELAPSRKGLSSNFAFFCCKRFEIVVNRIYPPSQQQSQGEGLKVFFKSNYFLGCFFQTTNQKVSYHQFLK